MKIVLDCGLWRMAWWAALMAAGGLVAGAGQRHELRRGDMVVVIETDTNRLEEKFGPRFDRTAQIVSVRRGGVEFVAEMGLPDEFGHRGEGLPGLDEGAAGFVKPGVGLLERPAGDGAGGYDFHMRAKVLARGVVEVEAGEAGLVARQRMPEAAGTVLVLEKRYTLEEEPGVLTVAWRLVNEGAEVYQTDHYNHHFFRLSEAGPGPGYRVYPRGVPHGPPALVRGFEVRRGEWRLTDTPGKGRAAYVGFSREDACEHATPAGAAGFLLAHSDGGRVDFDAGAPAELLAVWAGPEGMCPEVFVRVAAEAGGEARFTQRYRFWREGAGGGVNWPTAQRAEAE